MQFAIGDKVIHPQYGPGQITGIEGSESSDGGRQYYVIGIPRKGLTVHTPVGKAGGLGVRHAMSPSRIQRILNMLSGKPHHLPDDYKARQQLVGDRLETGQAVQLAGVVRDLSWREKLSHLTKKDSDLLGTALELLAAEIALVSGETVSEVRELITTRLRAAMGAGSIPRRAD